MNDIDKLQKVCMKVIKHFKYDVTKLGFEVHQMLDDELEKNGFPTKEYHDELEKNGFPTKEYHNEYIEKIAYGSSPSKILANDAIINSFHNQFIMSSVLGMHPDKLKIFKKDDKKED